MIFFKTILIQLPCNPFKYIFVHMRQKSESVKGNCYLNSISMTFSLILNLPIKRPSVQKTLHFSAIRLVCSCRPTNRQYMAIYGVLQTV